MVLGRCGMVKKYKIKLTATVEYEFEHEFDEQDSFEEIKQMVECEPWEYLGGDDQISQNFLANIEEVDVNGD